MSMALQDQSPESLAVASSRSYVEPFPLEISNPGRTSAFGVGFESPANTFDYIVLKRAFDIGIVLLFSPFLLAICTTVSLLVMLSSPGPIFFSHRRIRRGGAFFSMWKFRTMCQNSAEVLERHLSMHPEDREEWLLNHKLKHDPRITGIGNVLRRSSLDELPQIWNVLTGRMSLVGPRPIVAAEVEKYRSDFAYYIAVKPGVTGLWQSSGRSTLTYDERVALDRKYVENWSLWLDLKILVRTVRCVVNSDGAF
jgi:lipopolysaccharide/colanic/teichoic acid biosynthesis glycosyltransferase